MNTSSDNKLEFLNEVLGDLAKRRVKIWDDCDTPGGQCILHDYTQGSEWTTEVSSNTVIYCRTLESAANGAPPEDARQVEFETKCIEFNEEHPPTQEEIDALNAFYDDLIEYNAKFDD